MWIDVLKGKLRHWLADCGAGAGLATGAGLGFQYTQVAADPA